MRLAIKMEQHIKNRIVALSPFLIILVNVGVALASAQAIGKWAFIPVVLVEWCLFLFFVWRFAGMERVKSWLAKPQGHWGWKMPALASGLLPLPIFLMHYHLLAPWQIWLPWLILALANPWIEEFYWRGLLLEYTDQWPGWASVLFVSFLFAANHAVFGITSELLRGPEILISTFIMGIIWALTFKKTMSLRWAIAAHFMVDIFSLSAPSFLDLYQAGR